MYLSLKMDMNANANVYGCISKISSATGGLCPNPLTIWGSNYSKASELMLPSQMLQYDRLVVVE